ncbi:MAG: thiosulfate oxidation carrier protein SoxY [Gammaproteobacteria bacterium]|nr:thiosulfate oxidation carrier protein SoxY [Gammaproteobacteria bacterium]
MISKRRIFMKGGLAASAIGVAVGAGLLSPRRVLAKWPSGSFEAESVDAAMKASLGGDQAADSSDVTVKAPDIAENGAVVPVTVSSTLTGVTTIALLVEKNARPLTASYDLAEGTEAYVSNRIKMGKTSDVVAVVKAGGKLYQAKKSVKVTIGGCGG